MDKSRQGQNRLGTWNFEGCVSGANYYISVVKFHLVQTDVHVWNWIWSGVRIIIAINVNKRQCGYLDSSTGKQ